LIVTNNHKKKQNLYVHNATAQREKCPFENNCYLYKQILSNNLFSKNKQPKPQNQTNQQKKQPERLYEISVWATPYEKKSVKIRSIRVIRVPITNNTTI